MTDPAKVAVVLRALYMRDLVADIHRFSLRRGPGMPRPELCFSEQRDFARSWQRCVGNFSIRSRQPRNKM